MIYLIDDKKERQKNLGWDKSKLSDYENVLCPVYSYDEVLSLSSEVIFAEGNTIAFHESFFDNPLNSKGKNSVEIHQKMIDFTKDKSVQMVFFSGSIAARNMTPNFASLPVSLFYQNLELFATKYEVLDGLQTKLDLLVYGAYAVAEKSCELKQEIWNILYEYEDSRMVVPSFALNEKVAEFTEMNGITMEIEEKTVGQLKVALQAY